MIKILLIWPKIGIRIRRTCVKLSCFFTDQVQVGAISFSKTVSPQFGLGEYDGREDMLNKIEQISYEGLGTNTAEALNYLYEKVGYK